MRVCEPQKGKKSAARGEQRGTHVHGQDAVLRHAAERGHGCDELSHHRASLLLEQRGRGHSLAAQAQHATAHAHRALRVRELELVLLQHVRDRRVLCGREGSAGTHCACRARAVAALIEKIMVFSTLWFSASSTPGTRREERRRGACV